MSASEEVPASELEARRERLKALKDKAGAKGFTMNRPQGAAAAAAMKPQAGRAAAAPGPSMANDPGGENAFSGDRSKYFAAMMLNTLKAKPDDDKNAKTIPGTVFTEFGVTRLMEGLKERSELTGAQGRAVMKRFYDFLVSPAAAGQQMAAGVNLEHLERFANFLAKMQASGWESVRNDLLSGNGKDMLEAFSKPRIEVLEGEVERLKQQVANLILEVAELRRK